MSGEVGLRFLDWDLNKSRFDEINNLPLMETPGPVLMILALYLLFILKIGPSVMTKREPYKLKGTLIFYNGLQVLFSIYLVQICITQMMAQGLFPTKCYLDDENERKEILRNIWIYFFAKITELLDTVFFVLRKKDKQITFLHLYHHSIMLIGTWATLKYWPSGSLIFIGFINSVVHVFMYVYYGLSAFGPQVAKYIFWKRYMTRIQLIQFVIMIVQHIIAVHSSECPPPKGAVVFVASNAAFFLILFLNFYRQSYIRRKSSSKEVVNNHKVIIDKQS